jgi:gamma-glutamyltranspeptidase / glutathione hydrolase
MRTQDSFSRRAFLQQTAAGSLCLAATGGSISAAADVPVNGVIRGEPTAEKVGLAILAKGGNAIDAAVAAAMTAAVVAPHQTGIGGYGGHMTLALAGTGRITSIDFNCAAPAAARDDMFPLDHGGKVVGQANMYGWRAAGVPGILAGLELALKRYGTLPFREVVQPAIRHAREGFPFGSAAIAARSSAKQLAADPGSAVLYLRDGQPLAASDRYANPDLARLLESLAQDNSVESFYRGEIAERIASAFKAGGGLVTTADMATYQACEVQPLTLDWDGSTIQTAPLTAGGATMLQAMRILQHLKWSDRDPASPDTLQFQVEAFRYAWQDRLQSFGDPEKADVPIDKLLSEGHAKLAATEIERAVAAKQPLPVRTTSRPDQGTISLSAADRHGNLVAVTLTHGGSFGARVTVPGLGLTLGHGMSRFDPTPGHPNAPGPGKRPLNNMCPTIVAKNGQPVFAIGARGGRKIPNAVAEVLLQIVAHGKDLPAAVAAPRLHTEGQLALSFERHWPAEQAAALKDRGYTVTTAASATVSAVGFVDSPVRFVNAMR